RLLSATITLSNKVEDPILKEHQVVSEPEFGDSYKALNVDVATGSATIGTGKKKGRIVALTTEDMQKRKNNVKARTTLLLALPDEHQLRFSKYKTAQEIWDAILKTFGGNEATKKTKKNLLKQQYGNFKAEGSETLEQTFIRLQIIVSQLEFMDIEIEQDVYESKVQRKSESNSQNMAFISSAKNSSRKEEVNTASIPTASTNVSPASANIGAASINQDTACAYIASQSNGSQIKFEDINRIDEDDIESALSAIRWATLQGSAGLPEAKTREAEATTDKGLRPSPAIESTSVDVQNRNPSVTETEISPSTILSKPFIKFMKAADRPTEDKTDKVETAKKTTVDHESSWAKNKNTHKSRTPRAVFHKTGRPPIRTNRPYINAAQPKRTSFYKPAHSYLNKPLQRTSTVRSQLRGPRVPTVNRKLPTVNRKFPIGNSKFSTADMGNKGKAGNSQNHIDDKGYWDSGCSQYMTDNISYLFDYEPFDGGYVSFRQGGCKITGKGAIKTGKIEFKNVYFVKDLKEVPRTILMTKAIRTVAALGT
nr:ribonuclease H-like domain-containing protein [Tanacetum cinerariifolium]